MWVCLRLANCFIHYVTLYMREMQTTHICYSIMVGTFYWLLMFSHWANDIFLPLTLNLTLMDTFLHLKIFINTLFRWFIKLFLHRDNWLFLKSLYYTCRDICVTQCRQNQIHMHTHRLMQRHTTCFSKGGAVLEFAWQCCVVENTCLLIYVWVCEVIRVFFFLFLWGLIKHLRPES